MTMIAASLLGIFSFISAMLMIFGWGIARDKSGGEMAGVMGQWCGVVILVCGAVAAIMTLLGWYCWYMAWQNP